MGNEMSIRDYLKQLGLNLNAKIKKSEVQALLGATFQKPEWFRLDTLRLKIPPEYASLIVDQAKQLDRLVNMSSIEAARYGRFHEPNGGEVLVDGLIYQYSNQFNPVEKGFSYGIFKNGILVSTQGGFKSLDEARHICDAKASENMVGLLV
jgi:hypothetical protein